MKILSFTINSSIFQILFKVASRCNFESRFWSLRFHFSQTKIFYHAKCYIVSYCKSLDIPNHGCRPPLSTLSFSSSSAHDDASGVYYWVLFWKATTKAIWKKYTRHFEIFYTFTFFLSRGNSTRVNINIYLMIIIMNNTNNNTFFFLTHSKLKQ